MKFPFDILRIIANHFAKDFFSRYDYDFDKEKSSDYEHRCTTYCYHHECEKTVAKLREEDTKENLSITLRSMVTVSKYWRDSILDIWANVNHEIQGCRKMYQSELYRDDAGCRIRILQGVLNENESDYQGIFKDFMFVKGASVEEFNLWMLYMESGGNDPFDYIIKSANELTVPTVNLMIDSGFVFKTKHLRHLKNPTRDALERILEVTDMTRFNLLSKENPLVWLQHAHDKRKFFTDYFWHDALPDIAVKSPPRMTCPRSSTMLELMWKQKIPAVRCTDITVELINHTSIFVLNNLLRNYVYTLAITAEDELLIPQWHLKAIQEYREEVEANKLRYKRFT